MNAPQTAAFLALISLLTCAAMAANEPAPRAVLGKIDFQSLYDTVPAPAATAADAGRRAYAAHLNESSPSSVLDTFYDAHVKRAAAARSVIEATRNGRTARTEARSQRAIAEANASPLISRMGGIDKMGQMSEAEIQQAAMAAIGGYTQSMSGAPQGVQTGGGMQAMTQRLMSDPAYQARFEKMSKKEQEAELQKYMGNANAPPPPTGPTAAERVAQQATDEGTAAMARQQALGDLLQRLHTVDADFDSKDKAIAATPGGYKQIDSDFSARMARLPIVGEGEAGPFADPAQVQALERERALRQRDRATAELQQRAALYGQRRTKFKEVAAAYTAWLKQDPGPRSSSVAQQLDEGTVDGALDFEWDLIDLSDRLRTYSARATGEAAAYEQAYQYAMSQPKVAPYVKR